jgi:hypothetical protein
MRLNFTTSSFKHSFKHLYIGVSFLRSSLSHTYYSRLYSELHSPLTLFFLWTHPSESVPLPCPMSSLVVRPQGWAPLVRDLCRYAAWTWLRAVGEWEIRHTQTLDMNQKIEICHWEGCTFLVGYASTFLSHSVYFKGQYKEKTPGEIKLQQFFDLRKKEWGLVG